MSKDAPKPAHPQPDNLAGDRRALGSPPDEVEGIEMLTPVDQDDVTGESPDRATDSGTGGASGGLNAEADGLAGAQQANEEGDQ